MEKLKWFCFDLVLKLAIYTYKKKCGRLFYASFGGMKGRESIQKTDLTLMRYCGYFLIKTEGGAKNYKRDHRLQFAWRSFTVALGLL